MNRNLNITTAREVLELAAMLKARVKEARGIELHTEVEIIGDEN
jgi:UDP-N-acetylenolpyruvoylglucosamine reductase